MANPPTPLTPNASPVTHGTIIHFGLKDLAVTGIMIDSYKRDEQFADTQEVTNQAGVVVGVRMTDFRANVSIEGRVIDDGTGGITYTVKAGDVLEVNGDHIVINQCSYSGQAKGFHSLSISGVAYSGIANLLPAGISVARTE
jgi:hypothetical protein